MITAGRIEVNRKITTLGSRVSKYDVIHIDRKLSPFTNPKKVRVLLYYKLEGEICTRKDPKGRTTVFKNLPQLENGRWISIGRLDINTSGLLLFTNEGTFANRLMHPATQVEREYAVRVLGVVNSKMSKKLTYGIELEDGIARFEDIVDIGGDKKNHWFHVVIVEGRNRLVRRLWTSQGVKVSRLIRVRFGSIILPKSLHRGMWKELDTLTVSRLKKIVQ